MTPQHSTGRSDHTCKCNCAGCTGGNHCHNLASGCRAQHW